MSLLEPEVGRDALALREMLDSAAWKMFESRVRAVVLERARDSLENEGATEAVLRFNQGRVSAIRAVLDLPERMITELEEKKRG